MKRSWLIGAALVFSLTTVGCKDDDEDDDDTTQTPDAGRDAGRDSGAGPLDAGGMDSSTPDASRGDAGGDAGRDAS